MRIRGVKVRIAMRGAFIAADIKVANFVLSMPPHEPYILEKIVSFLNFVHLHRATTYNFLIVLSLYSYKSTFFSFYRIFTDWAL